MYLSKLLLDPASRQVQKELANRYELHRTLCTQFQDVRRDEVGLLFRLEDLITHEYQPLNLLVQTQIEPCWDTLYKNKLLLKSAEIKKYDPKLIPGIHFRFRLLANPTMRRAKGKFAGKRVELQTQESQIDWIIRKGKLGGFKVISSDSQNIGKFISSKHQKEFEIGLSSERINLTHLAVLFEGYLEVVDGNLMHNSICKGIGSAKAFGFGLLSIAPTV